MRNLKQSSKRTKLLIVVLLLVFMLATAVPGVNGAEQGQDLTISFNGHNFRADAYIEDGVTWISAQSLQLIPGMDVAEIGYIPLRKFIEDRGGDVFWNGEERSIALSWREINDGWMANQLVAKSDEVLKKFNTYRMVGTSEMKMSITGDEAVAMMPMPSFNIEQEGVFRQEPLAMYLIQKMMLPLDEMGLSPEELELFGGEAMVTEMVWTDNAIYQKTPMIEQWIVQDLSQLGMTELVNQLTQVSPQQSLDMMAKFGIFYTFGDDVTIDGQEYYVVNSSIDSETFREMMDELLGDFLSPELLLGGTELSLMEQQEFDQEMAQVFAAIEAMLKGMKMDYSFQTLINKNTFTSDYMYFDMVMTLAMDAFPGAPESAGMTMEAKGEFALSSFGEEIELPDTSDAITQAEYMELMMSQFLQ